jgi:hypothetical protein
MPDDAAYYALENLALAVDETRRDEARRQGTRTREHGRV